MNNTQLSGPDVVSDVLKRFQRELPDIDPVVLETVCRLIVAGKTLEQSAALMLKQLDFNYTDFDVLGMLRSAGPPYEMTPAQLLRFAMITSGAMTTCLDRLERAGMIRRRMSDTDRRARLVSLTAKGKRTIEKGLKLRYDAAQDIFASLSAAEMQQLNSLLEKMSNQVR